MWVVNNSGVSLILAYSILITQEYYLEGKRHAKKASNHGYNPTLLANGVVGNPQLTAALGPAATS